MRKVISPLPSVVTVCAGLLLFSSCSVNPWRARNTCIDPDELHEILLKFEKTADIEADLQHIPPGATQQLVDQCHKKVYIRREYRCVIFQNPDDRDQGTTLSITPAKPKELDNAHCMKQAISDIESLGIPYFTKILQDYHAMYNNLWDDPDIGPLKWLSCKKSDRDVYNDYSTLLHELNHELKRGICLNLPSQSKSSCLEWVPYLQGDTLARINLEDIKNEESKKFIEGVENLYLNEKGHIFSLIDEINSYTISNDVEIAAIRKLSPISPQKPEIQGMGMLALFCDMTFHYLEKLKSNDPSSFERAFGSGTKNREVLIEVTKIAEESFVRGLTLLRERNSKLAETQNLLWENYKRERKNLGF